MNSQFQLYCIGPVRVIGVLSFQKSGREGMGVLGTV